MPEDDIKNVAAKLWSSYKKRKGELKAEPTEPQDLSSLMERMKKLRADISTASKMKLDLMHEDDRFKILEENISDIIWTMDSDLKITYFSPSISRVLGYEMEEAMELTLEKLLAPSSLFTITRAFREELASKSKRPDRTIEMEMLRKDLSSVWTEGKITLLRDAEGDPVGILGVARDITIRKKAEEQLMESQRTMSTLLGNLNGMAYRCNFDKDLTAEFISEGSYDLIEYHPEDLMGNSEMNFYDLIVPEDQDPVWEEMERAVEKREPYTLTYRLRTPSGELKWVWEQGVGIYSSDGTLRALEGFITDISIRKKFEEDLERSKEEMKASEERFRRLFENMLEGVFWTTPEGDYINVNQSFLDIFKFDSLEDLIEYGPADMLYANPKARGEFKEWLEREGELRNYEIRMKRKDGKEVTVLENVIAVKDEFGRVTHYEGTMQNITKRKKFEKKLKQSEAQYKLLVERAGIGILIDDEKGQITFTNRTLQDMLGYSEKELLGKRIKEIIHPGDLKTVVTRHKKRLKDSNAPERFRFRALKKNGKTLSLEVDVVKIYEKDKVVGTRNYMWETGKKKGQDPGKKEPQMKRRVLKD